MFTGSVCCHVCFFTDVDIFSNWSPQQKLPVGIGTFNISHIYITVVAIVIVVLLLCVILPLISLLIQLLKAHGHAPQT